MRSSPPNERGLFARTAALGPNEWLDLIVAAFELGRARLELGANAEHLFEQAGEGPTGDARRAQFRIDRIRTAIARVSHRLPWRADCLVQALAAQHWLARHGLPSRVSVGVRERGADPFEAHAWLVCGDTVVTGGNVSDYVPLQPPAR